MSISVKPRQVARRVLWIGSGRFDRRIGVGIGQRARRVPDAGIGPSAWADGTVRQLAWGANWHRDSTPSGEPSSKRHTGTNLKHTGISILLQKRCLLDRGAPLIVA